jgi:hypothetical protein
VKKRPLAWAAVVAAALELLAALWLLSDTWNGSPVAAPFTRVGGATRVETAVEASRFWLKPPPLIVEVSDGTSKTWMLEAARCAMVKDAPLLFTWKDPKRNRLVTATIDAWQAVSPGSAQRQRIRGCVPRGPTDPGGVSTLAGLLPLPGIAISGTLNTVVVFAAVWAPDDPADVAVGMALAAHLARADQAQVSLIVVPRYYLETDPGLENQLRSQRDLVKEGVVLGSTSVMPEDTRTLLRQLLRSADQQGVLAQLENTLGTAGVLITALAGLITFAVAAAAAPVLIRELIGIQQSAPGGKPDGPKPDGPKPERERRRFMARNDWLAGLPKERSDAVTIWLRSGQKVTGTMHDVNPGKVANLTVLRLDGAKVWPDGSGQEQDALYLLVPVDDIKLIGVDVKPMPTGTTGAS